MTEAPKLVKAVSYGLALEGVIRDPITYEAAALAAMEKVFLGPNEPYSRLVARVCEGIFGVVNRDKASKVEEAIQLLDRQAFLVQTEKHKVRLTCVLGKDQDQDKRTWALNLIMREGVRPHVMNATMGVTCMVAEKPDPKYPYIIADVPRDYDPALAEAKPGDTVTIKRIPKDFIVGVNGLPYSSFQSCW